MGNWFGKSGRGFLMGIWAGNANVKLLLLLYNLKYFSLKWGLKQHGTNPPGRKPAGGIELLILLFLCELLRSKRWLFFFCCFYVISLLMERQGGQK